MAFKRPWVRVPLSPLFQTLAFAGKYEVFLVNTRVFVFNVNV